MPQGTEYTKQRAEWFKQPPQGKDESDHAFRERVAGAIRALGHPIEAHEAFNNCLYDDPAGGAMTGIMGAIAQRMHGAGIRQVGDDIAAGVVASTKQPSAEALLLMIMLTDNKDQR